MIQHTEQNNCTFMQWWIFFITVHGGNLAVLNTHICINPPPCMLICSIYCKLHYPCSQHRCLFTIIHYWVFRYFSCSFWWSLVNSLSIFSETRDQHISLFHLLCLCFFYLPIPLSPHSCFSHSIFIIILSLSLSSLSEPQSFPVEHWCMWRQGSTQSPIQSSSTSPPRISQSPTWDGWGGRG